MEMQILVLVLNGLLALGLLYFVARTLPIIRLEMRRRSRLLFALAALGVLAGQAVEVARLAKIGAPPEGAGAAFLTVFFLSFLIGLYTVLVVEQKEITDLQHRSVTDPLTGLYDRAYLHHHLLSRTKELRYDEHEQSILFADIDNFKPYNDQFGHGAGDELLKRVAETLTREARVGDVVVRYGGEEFVIAAGVDHENAVRMAERIRASIQERCSVQFDPELERDVTISIGVACWKRDAQNILELIPIADQRMYEAKRRGKNRVYAG